MQILKKIFTSNPLQAIYLSFMLAFITWVIISTALSVFVPTTQAESNVFSDLTRQLEKTYKTTALTMNNAINAHCDAWVGLALSKAIDYSKADMNSEASQMSQKAADLLQSNCGFTIPQ